MWLRISVKHLPRSFHLCLSFVFGVEKLENPARTQLEDTFINQQETCLTPNQSRPRWAERAFQPAILVKCTDLTCMRIFNSILEF